MPLQGTMIITAPEPSHADMPPDLVYVYVCSGTVPEVLRNKGSTPRRTGSTAETGTMDFQDTRPTGALPWTMVVQTVPCLLMSKHSASWAMCQPSAIFLVLGQQSRSRSLSKLLE